MKSFAIAAFAGAACAAWAPPAYGDESSSPVASAPADEYSAPPAEEYSTSPAEYSQEAPAYTQPASSYTPSISTAAIPSQPAYSAPGYSEPEPSSAASASSIWATSYATGGYGTGSVPVYPPKPTGGYGSGNGTAGSPGGDSYVTQIVTSFETYCPGPTTLTYNSQTYTLTEATTLTVTDCPCQVTTPVQSYSPTYTTELVTSFTTTYPEATVATFGPATYTISESTVLTVTDCGDAGCTVTKEVPGTFVVPTYTTQIEQPAEPTIVSIGAETYPVSQATVLTVVAPTSYEIYTSIVAQPEQPTSYVIESSTYQITAASTIVYSKPVQGGVTITAPISEVPGYNAPAATPVAPISNVPSGYGSPGNGSSPVSPSFPEQTANGAEKMAGSGVAFAAVLGALLL